MKTSIDLRFQVVEVPTPEDRVDDLLNFVVDLLIKRWLEGKRVRSAEEEK
jgi:hypothetical protein